MPSAFHHWHWLSTQPHAVLAGSETGSTSHVVTTPGSALHTSLLHPAVRQSESALQSLGNPVPSKRSNSGCVAGTAALRATTGPPSSPGPGPSGGGVFFSHPAARAARTTAQRAKGRQR